MRLLRLGLAGGPQGVRRAGGPLLAPPPPAPPPFQVYTHLLKIWIFFEVNRGPRVRYQACVTGLDPRKTISYDN
jgi:hypothetical protein